MKNLLQRTLTGIVFVSIIIGCISWNKWSTAILFLFFSTLGTIEFYQILKKRELSNNSIYGPVVNVVIYSLMTLAFIDVIHFEYLFIGIPFLIVLVLMELFSKDDIPYQNISSTLFALFYITLPFSALNYLSFNSMIYEKIELSTNWSLLAGYFIILWTSDSMAYIVGRLIGKHKLFERISPGKTWEGFFGGVVFSVLAGYLFAYFTDSSMLHWMIMGVIISVFGTLGDLSESLLKRSGDVKDSGTILPGHGGVLDRFDGILFSAPLILAYLLFI